MLHMICGGKFTREADSHRLQAKCDSQSNNRISCSNKEDAAKTACSANAVSTETKENGKHLTVANAPIEEILEYINEKDNAAAQAAANKAAKRARQKQRKQVLLCYSFF